MNLINQNSPECKVVHCKKEDYDVYIGRPSKWGNPFSHIKDKETRAEFIVKSRQEAIQAYENWILLGDGRRLLSDLTELKGKVLGCWCHPKGCHGHVLAKLVNNLSD
jgi:hypothetical protein